MVLGSDIVCRPRVWRVEAWRWRNCSVFTRTSAAVCYDVILWTINIRFIIQRVHEKTAHQSIMV